MLFLVELFHSQIYWELGIAYNKFEAVFSGKEARIFARKFKVILFTLESEIETYVIVQPL